MGKKEGNMIENLISDEVVSKLIDVVERKADIFLRMNMENNNRKIKLEEKKFDEEQKLKEKKLQAKQNFCKEEQESVKKEFNRIMEKLIESDPTSDDYRKLTESLYNLKKLLNGWGGSSFDWD